MGAAASIAEKEYDPVKFEKSKVVMESSATDEEKFIQLKEIWDDNKTEAVSDVTETTTTTTPAVVDK